MPPSRLGVAPFVDRVVEIRESLFAQFAARSPPHRAFPRPPAGSRPAASGRRASHPRTSRPAPAGASAPSPTSDGTGESLRRPAARGPPASRRVPGGPAHDTASKACPRPSGRETSNLLRRALDQVPAGPRRHGKPPVNALLVERANLANAPERGVRIRCATHVLGSQLTDRRLSPAERFDQRHKHAQAGVHPVGHGLDSEVAIVVGDGALGARILRTLKASDRIVTEEALLYRP